MRPVRVGVLGLGGIGTTHARALASLASAGEGVILVAASGGSDGALAETGWPDAERMSPGAVLDRADLDVIAVCTPSALHAEHTLTALERGIHVVVEKPMATTVADAQRIVELATARGLIVSPLAQRRLEPANRYLKELLDDGRLGRVVLAETFVHWHRPADYYTAAPWRVARDGGGGSLMNQGLHNADLLCWLLGGAETVTGQTATLGHPGLDVEDTCVATLQFSSGALGVIVTTTATPPGEPAELALWTTTGSARLDQSGVVRWGFTDVPAPPDPAETITGAADPAAIGISGHVDQWRDVVHAVRSGAQPLITAADGLATVRVLAGIYAAAEHGHRVRVQPGAGSGELDAGERERAR